MGSWWNIVWGSGPLQIQEQTFNQPENEVLRFQKIKVAPNCEFPKTYFDFEFL